MKTLSLHLPQRALGLAKSFGPYAAIELFLPGGSLVALVLLALRHYARKGVRS